MASRAKETLSNKMTSIAPAPKVEIQMDKKIDSEAEMYGLMWGMLGYGNSNPKIKTI